jgi:8-oxo-dGTP diphosphatase
MHRYSKQDRQLIAVDCIIFGFDGTELKLLLIHRGFEPEMGKWSLMGGFVKKDESADDAALRILKQLTGLEGIYLEQLHAFTDPRRDPVERTVSIAYFALIDIQQYQEQLSDEYKAVWFSLNKIPGLVFDHREMVKLAKERLRYKAGLYPVLFELLPKDFTIPQIQTLYESIYSIQFDKRNFSRKILSSGLLIKQGHKDKNGSKKGAWYFRLHKKAWTPAFPSFLNIISKAPSGN